MKLIRFTGLTTALSGVLALAAVAAGDGGASAEAGAGTAHVRTATIGTGSANGDVAVDQSTHRAYVAGYSGDRITVIDTTTNAQITTFTTGYTPQGLSVDEARNILWVAETGANAVVALDATTGAVLRTIRVTSPQRLVYDPVSDDVYVTQFHSSNDVLVIDAATGGLLTSIPSGSRPADITVNPTARQAYVSNTNGSSISIIDTAAHTLRSTVTLPARPNELAVDTSTGVVYVSLADDTVARIDPATGSIIDSFPATGPRGISINPAGGYVAVTSLTTPTVNVFSTTGTLLQAVPVTSANWSVGVDLSNSTLYVSADSSPHVFVLQELTKPAITSSAPADGVQGVPYSHTVTATGSPKITFSATTDRPLPPGLTLNPGTGVISGTPTDTGIYTVTITATNKAGADTANYSLKLTPAGSATTPQRASQGPSVNTGGTVVPGRPTAGLLIAPAGLLLAIGAAILALRRRSMTK